MKKIPQHLAPNSVRVFCKKEQVNLQVRMTEEQIIALLTFDEAAALRDALSEILIEELGSDGADRTWNKTA